MSRPKTKIRRKSSYIPNSDFAMELASYIASCSPQFTTWLDQPLHIIFELGTGIMQAMKRNN